MKLQEIKSYNGSFLRAADFSKTPKTLTIKRYEVKNLNGTDKLVIHFNELKGSLVLNQTNAVTLGNEFGDELNDWLSKPVTMWAEQIQFRDKLVDSIKVKPAKKPAPKPVEKADGNLALSDVQAAENEFDQ